MYELSFVEGGRGLGFGHRSILPSSFYHWIWIYTFVKVTGLNEFRNMTPFFHPFYQPFQGCFFAIRLEPSLKNHRFKTRYYTPLIPAVSRKRQNDLCDF